MTQFLKPIPVVIDTSSLFPILSRTTPYQKPLPKLWRQRVIQPYATDDTIEELRLILLDRDPPNAQALKIYEPYCALIKEPLQPCLPKCRDETDQIFINLATHVHAQYLIARDKDLRSLNGQTPFQIVTDTQFRKILS